MPRSQGLLRTLWNSLTYPGFLHFRYSTPDTPFGDPEFSRLNDALVHQKVMTERVRVFAVRSFEGALTAPLGTMLLAWIGSRVTGWTTALIWFAAFCVIEMVIASWSYGYRTEGPHRLDAPTRGRILVALNFVAGLAWGSTVFVFWVDGQITSYLLILTILVGVSAAGLLVMSTFFMALVGFYVGLLVPPIVHALLIPDTIGVFIAIGLTILYGLALQHGSVVGLQLVRDLESTVRNEMLAERLRMALDAAEQDWFDLNPATGQMIVSARYALPGGKASVDADNGYQQWLGDVHADDRELVRSAFGGALHSDHAIDSEYRSRATHDTWRWIRSVGRVVERDDKGNALRIIGIHSDITDRKRVEAQIRTLAFYDHLTDLPNRRLLNERLQHAIASASRHRLYGALLMLDMDNFKALNDTQGHDVGDKFLIEVARRIESCTRKTDTVARQGGDEFMILLECIGKKEDAAIQAKAIAEKTLEAICQPYLLDLVAADGKTHTYSYHCTASIGVTLFADDSKSADELMKRADTAMYQAKESGRNSIRFFDLEMQQEVTARAALDNDLRAGVQQGQFVLFYQPQFNHTGAMTGVEALLRWRHPVHGLLEPHRFIALAETNGMILPIGRFVMEAACAQLGVWALGAETRHLKLSVNVSAVQFADTDFTNHTVASVEKSGVDPRRLKIEITETLLLNNIETTVETMHALKARGIGFSLDDFGIGYSSLAYLKRLPIDQIKIDQSFVRDVLTDANDAAIARAIIALAKSMELEVIAEGVETEAQRHFLKDNGCFGYQGYFYARPMPIEEFEKFLHERSAQEASPMDGHILLDAG
jgi:diguanylate cyclase (GGDEF)-like protein